MSTTTSTFKDTPPQYRSEPLEPWAVAAIVRATAAAGSALREWRDPDQPRYDESYFGTAIVPIEVLR